MVRLHGYGPACVDFVVIAFKVLTKQFRIVLESTSTGTMNDYYSITAIACQISVVDSSPRRDTPPTTSNADVPAGLRKSDFLYTIFLPNYPPISIPFLIGKHPNLPESGAFY